MGSSMDTVTVSTEFQVVLPEQVRRRIGIRAGDQLAVIAKHGVITLVPVRPFEASRGVFQGTPLDPLDVRDESERF